MYVNNTTVDFRNIQCETDCIHVTHVRILLDQILKECSLSCRQLVIEDLWLEHAWAKTGF
jgi:hypothetical protein